MNQSLLLVEITESVRPTTQWRGPKLLAPALTLLVLGAGVAGWRFWPAEGISFQDQAEIMKKVALFQKVRLLSNLTDAEMKRHGIDVVALPPLGPLFQRQKETEMIARNLGFKKTFNWQHGTLTVTEETSKDMFIRVSSCMCDAVLASLKFMSALLSLEAAIHVCNLPTPAAPESPEKGAERVPTGNRRLGELPRKASRASKRRLAFNVPQASVAGASVEEARMTCAGQINGIVSSFLAVSQYVSDTVTTCPSPNNIPKGSNYPSRCSMSISVLTSGLTKSAAALSDIAIQCADPTSGEIPYSKPVNPDRKPEVLAACLNNIGQAMIYLAKASFELNSLATEPGKCPKFPTNYQRYVCTEHIGSLLADLGQIATYLAGAASGCGSTTLVPYACTSRIAATVTGLFDGVQGVGGALAWCSYGYIREHVAEQVQDVKKQAHNALISHTIDLN